MHKRNFQFFKEQEDEENKPSIKEDSLIKDTSPVKEKEETEKEEEENEDISFDLDNKSSEDESKEENQVKPDISDQDDDTADHSTDASKSFQSFDEVHVYCCCFFFNCFLEGKKHVVLCIMAKEKKNTLKFEIKVTIGVGKY